MNQIVGTGGLVKRCVSELRRRPSLQPWAGSVSRAHRRHTWRLPRHLGEQLGRIELAGNVRSATSAGSSRSHPRRSPVRLNRLASVVRSRTAANGDSIGFVVRRCFQCACTRTGSIFVRGLDQKTIERLNDSVPASMGASRSRATSRCSRERPGQHAHHEACSRGPRGGGTDSVDRRTTLRSKVLSSAKAESGGMRSTGRPRWRRMPSTTGLRACSPRWVCRENGTLSPFAIAWHGNPHLASFPWGGSSAEAQGVNP